MEAVVNKLQLKRSFNGYYLKMELTDLNGYVHVINKPFLNDPINFRKQIFGLMSACGSYDLMRLATDKPSSKKVVGYYYMNGLKIFENEKEEWLSYDDERKEYICTKADNNKKKVIKMLIEKNVPDIFMEEGKIESITSESGVFELFFKARASASFYMTNQIYYGFGYPLNIGNEQNINDCKKAAQRFTSFIVSLMRFYGIDDLLRFGDNIEKLPIVQINVNSNNEVDLITNPSTGIGLSITKKYDIVNVFESQKRKTK